MPSDRNLEEPTDPSIAEQARAIAPVIWLIGKVQAGKSSIIRALTGSTEAQIGSGIRACTRTSRIFEFPNDAPLIRFLDTRGLGEARYDPADDIEIAHAASHCTIAVMRCMDLQQQSILRVLKQIRRRHRKWPIIVAQTHLHEGYPTGGAHIEPYPYELGQDAVVLKEGSASLPARLRESLEQQRALFDGLPGSGPIAFVPIDFTKEEDGYEPKDYGLAALQETIATVGPVALSAALEDAGREVAAPRRDHHAMIVAYASAAAAADLVPVAAVAAVPAVQAKLLHDLAKARGLTWTRRKSLEFAGALGAGALTRYAAGFGIRQLTKLIPAYGQTVGATAAAATSFATTFALGKTAEYYLERSERAGADRIESLKEVWSRSLMEAFELARRRGLRKQQDEPQ